MPHPRLDEIRRTYEYKCGYCEVHESEVGSELTLDHYQPRSADGTDEVDNLVYARVKCNQYKGEYWPTTAEKNAGLYVLHPRRHSVTTHLRQNEASAELESLTNTGAFHVRLLRLNRPPLVAHRLARRAVKIQQQRLLLLEAEATQHEQTIKELEEYINVLTALVATILRSEH